MSEQSDTPRMSIKFSGELGMSLLNRIAQLERERDEARAEVAEIEGAFRASGALNQKLLDEVDRLRPLTICGCGDHFAVNFEGTCPNCIAAGKEAKP